MVGTSYDICECGKRKSKGNAKCKSCHVAYMRSLKREKIVKHATTVRVCHGCFCEYNSSRKDRLCTSCFNWGRKFGYGLPLLRHHLEKCDDPARREKILASIIAEQTANPLVSAVLDRQEAQIAKLRAEMTEILRTNPFSSGADRDGFPIYKKTKVGYRCQQCRQAQKKRSCRLCEMKIRGQL